MAADRKLIVILIDGLSADYFTEHRRRLANLSALASEGTWLRRLLSPVPATSMPGRTSMMTGVPSQDHGVFGNHVFDGTSFRCAMPTDVAVPTILGRAKAAGMQVANVGYAMADPKDSHVYQPPWWLRGFLRESRFAKVLSDAAVAEVLNAQSGYGSVAHHPEETGHSANGLDDTASRLMKGFACDQQVIRAVAALACSDSPPDLIFTEIAMTDQIQHQFGYESQAAHWSLATADLLVGFLQSQLEAAGRQDDYVIAVTSDHGHSPIETAIFPDVVLPETQWESEGATLHVVIRDLHHSREVERRLSDFGAIAIGSDHVPERVRERIATFAAPPQHSFEATPQDHPVGAPIGAPAYISSHGLKPGSPADDRFCIFFGAGTSKNVVPLASAEQFCATLNSILGLRQNPYSAEPLTVA